MSKWIIDKEFGFDYGHRVWSQKLNHEFATDEQKPVCRHLHGHRCKLNVFLEGDELTRGMVTDFHHLNWVKKFLDAHLDHKFILDMNDPWFNNIINGSFEPVASEPTKVLKIPSNSSAVRYLKPKPVPIPNTDHWMGYELDTSELNGPEQEFYEGFFLVDFLPTSEHLCKWIFDGIQTKMRRLNIKVQRIEWNETPKSRSTYYG